MSASYYLGFAAGGLSLLAPCVLPILPLVISSSLRTSKWGPLIGAFGLTLAFTFFGMITSVFSRYIDQNLLRDFGAIILVLVGIIFLVPKAKNLLGPIFNSSGSLGARLQGKLPKQSLIGEFLGGSLLGLLWSPCTGPTLAFAVGLASQSENLIEATFIFFFFGLGAGLGLVGLGFLIQRFRWLRQKLLSLGIYLNIFTGVACLVIGLLILTGLEGSFQEVLLKLMPDWLIQLTVKY